MSTREERLPTTTIEKILNHDVEVGSFGPVKGKYKKNRGEYGFSLYQRCEDAESKSQNSRSPFYTSPSIYSNSKKAKKEGQSFIRRIRSRARNGSR